MTNKRSFTLAFAVGLLAVAWVALGFIGSSSWLALAVTLAIGAAYGVGAWELHQFRAATAGLAGALAQVPQPLGSLAEWLERVPAPLRAAVRLRVEGERGALPGPALTPYLVGLLVMLGMLGTFLGMVVTFKGAVFALEGSTDLQAIRAALAEPIRGLGLSFGASVAGVAASAMLGLMSTLSRRERVDVARQLEGRIAADLRPFSLAHQRQETFRVLQAQSAALPGVAAKLDALMDRIETRSQQLDDQLLQRQSQFHQDVARAYADLAQSVGTSMQASLERAARAAGDSLQPVVAGAMARIEQDAQRLHERLETRAQAQAQALSQHLGAQQQLLSTALEESARRLSQAAERDDLALQERTALLAQVDTLLQSVNQAALEQRGAIEALVASAADVLAQASERFTGTLQAQANDAADATAQARASAVELASLAESFHHGIQLFQAGSDKLVDSLQRIEASINRSTARSDEQLAYYVAQAREVIDLSIASQQGLVDRLRHLPARPAEAMALAGGNP